MPPLLLRALGATILVCLVALPSVSRGDPHGRRPRRRAPPGPGRISKHTFHFNSLGESRTVRVYTPAGYHADPSRRYPVLYMLDGQNVYEGGMHGGWHVNKAIEKVTRAGAARPAIVVAIDSGSHQKRMRDFAPVHDSTHGGGGGADRFLRAIVNELKPQVDRHMRTLRGREHTAMAGSSLGGLFSLYAAYKRPDVFGGVIAMSPTLGWSDSWLIKRFRASGKPRSKIIIDSGDLTLRGAYGGDNVTVTETLRDIFDGKGMRWGSDYVHWTARGHRHQETYWRQRFGQRYSELFGN